MSLKTFFPLLLIFSLHARDINLRYLDKLEWTGSGTLTIEQGAKNLLTISGHPDIKHTFGDLTVESQENVMAHLTVRTLNRIAISGNATVNIPDYQGDNLVLDLSGSPTLTMQIKANRLITDMSGSGTVTYSGEVDYQSAELKGSTSYNAENLKCREVELRLAGDGTAFVQGDEEVSILVIGKGTVHYKTDAAKVSKRVQGSGEIIQQ